jgi:hypothetical protein
MQLVEAIVALGHANLSSENSWYSWRSINHDFLPLGIGMLHGSEYAQNVELKHRLHQQWAAGDEGTRVALSQYYVATWGGVRRNKPETLARYAQEPVESSIARGKKGIPSWSKVLCIRDPNRYAIYDARVSVSLNLLQHLKECEKKELFPLLKGQNKSINAAVTQLSDLARNEGWQRLSEKAFYERYLGYAHQAGSELGVELCTVEMLLFAFAPKLAEQAEKRGWPSAKTCRAA